MLAVYPLESPLPPDARPALDIVRRLVEAGHQALLAGGCVRDLLLGRPPEDFDVATDALPETVVRLFRVTRQVGAQFGVVLVRQRGQWIEVATFRTDGPYEDGRRPASVTFTDAEHDALRRDFTINGMFLDPLERVIRDYVGGREDLRRRVVRAIGDPPQRFREDYLRILRAVRFAAGLDFAIEPQTFQAMRAAAANLPRVAPERVLQELVRMLEDPGRGVAVQLMIEAGLLGWLWPQADWSPERMRAAQRRVACLPREAGFVAALAMLLADRPAAEIEMISRHLTLSNEQRETVLWLVEHQAQLDEPAGLSPAGLKRLMAHPAFDELCGIARARWSELPDGAQRWETLRGRLAAIDPAAVRPPPLVTGDDLLARGVPPGPIYRRVLERLYERQLNEELRTREAALAELDHLLAQAGS